MKEPTSKEEYTARYAENYRTSGSGLEGTTQHFPCPFCAAPDWDVVRVVDFAPPQEPGYYERVPIECGSCGRAGKLASQRHEDGSVVLLLVQTAGPDPAEWVAIAREEPT